MSAAPELPEQAEKENGPIGAVFFGYSSQKAQSNKWSTDERR
jgi:hypothetical protein